MSEPNQEVGDCTYRQFMAEVWQRYRDGDHLEDHELEMLARDTERAAQALGYRPDYGCVNSELSRQLQAMKGYLRSRRLRKKEKRVA